MALIDWDYYWKVKKKLKGAVNISLANEYRNHVNVYFNIENIEYIYIEILKILVNNFVSLHSQNAYAGKVLKKILSPSPRVPSLQAITLIWEEKIYCLASETI